MRAIETVVTSARAEVVWKVLTDVERWRDWTPTVLEIKPVNGSGLAVGARYRVVQPKLRPAIYEVTDCVPNQRFTWKQKFPGGALLAEHRLTPRTWGTEVELSFTSKGLTANIAASLFSKMIREYVATEARSLKRRCDNLASEQPQDARSSVLT